MHEPFFFAAMCFTTVVFWVAGIGTTIWAIFCDSAAEGNFGGLALVLFAVALILSFITTAWADNR